MGRLKHWADAMWSRFINSRLVQTVLRYRKILLLSLAAVVVLSVVLYLCPWRLTTVYNDIDWEGLGETCTVVYQEVYDDPDGHIADRDSLCGRCLQNLQSCCRRGPRPGCNAPKRTGSNLPDRHGRPPMRPVDPAYSPGR